MKMRKHVIILSILLTAFSVQAQQAKSFVLKGKTKGLASRTLKLSYAVSEGNFIEDSARVDHGMFEFKGKLTEPVMAYLSLAGDNQPGARNDGNASMLFLSPSSMQMEVNEGDFKGLKLTGSKTHDEHQMVEQEKLPIANSSNPVLVKLQATNELYIKAKKNGRPESELDLLRENAAVVREQLEPFNRQRDSIDFAFIQKNPGSYYSAYLLRFKVAGMKVNDAQKYYELLTPAIKESMYGKMSLKEIKSLQSGSPGSIAFEFAKPDINGAQFDLAGYKGKKYVLLDFWASWCVPCRKGNPHLSSLYANYKDKGLEIVGVSDDDSALAAWKTAVVKDKIGVWRHVLRGLKRTSEGYDRSEDLNESYGIHSLPTKILIDKSGKIIGRYGGGGESDEALDKKLASIFD